MRNVPPGYEPDPAPEWEQRYQEWCADRRLDPDDTNHPPLYEEWWQEQLERRDS